jgi:transcription termination factor Rho
MTTITSQRAVGQRAARQPAAEAQESPPLPVSGILDVSDSHAFVRTRGYQQGPDDIYVSTAQVRQFGLRKGDQVEGAARPPRQGPARQGTAQQGAPRQGPAHQGAAQQGRGREKFGALVRLDTVNGMPPAQAKARPHFDALTPLYPQERLRLESDRGSPVARIIDLVSPIGKGQRGLIVAPPKAGKTMLLQAIAAAVTASHPEVHLMAVLVGERPEEVTDLRRTVSGEVIYSTFDQAAAEHVMLAELAIERAKRLVELGRDVVVLLDSITRLGRAYNLAAPPGARILTGGVAVSAVHPPRQFLGAARNIENGGSLTILSTALVETGSRMDDLLFEEFKGTGNMELRLRRELAEKRIFPAIDVAPSGTRRDDLLMSPDEHAAMTKLRQLLAGLDPQQAIELLLARTRETSSNAEFLRQILRSSQLPSRAGSAGF